MLRQGKGKMLPPVSLLDDSADSSAAAVDQQLARLLEAQLLTSNLCIAMGLPCDGLDAGLCALLRQSHRSLSTISSGMNNGASSTTAEPPINLEYHIACLLIVFVANALPQLARVDGCPYRLNLAANEGNTHCIAYALTTVMVSMLLWNGFGF